MHFFTNSTRDPEISIKESGIMFMAENKHQIQVDKFSN